MVKINDKKFKNSKIKIIKLKKYVSIIYIYNQYD